MQLLYETSDITFRPSVATIGFFDGVHQGHCFLINQVREIAAARGLASCVITFPVHPRKIMQTNYHPALLTTCDEKLALLAQTGVDYCIMLNFTSEVARLSAREFMAILKERYKTEVLVIGYDHRFGHNRSEDVNDYIEHGRILGIEVILAHAYSDSCSGGHKDMVTPGKGKAFEVSSSVIRRLLLAGDVSKAAECLGYNFFLEGVVVGGYRVGRKIGFPTANIRILDTDKLIPSDGVYAVNVFLNERKYDGMLSIGCRPTLNNGDDRSIEVHIFHFDSDIYDQPVRVSFVRYIRPEKKFDTLDALIDQLHQDEIEVKAIFADDSLLKK